MLGHVSHARLWVRDYEEALDFYTAKLGFEVRWDAAVDEQGGMRWVTIGSPRQPDFELILSTTRPDASDDSAAPPPVGMLVISVDDCRAACELLRNRGVEFTHEPTEHFYGTDAAFSDPSGNHIRIMQPPARRGAPAAS